MLVDAANWSLGGQLWFLSLVHGWWLGLGAGWLPGLKFLTVLYMLPRDEQRQKNLSFISNSNDTQCVNQLRMKRSPFYQLCDLFRSRGLLKDTFHCNIEEQVDMFLRVIGHNQRFRCIQVLFLRSCETLCRFRCRWNPYFKVCTRALMHNCPKFDSRCLK